MQILEQTRMSYDVLWVCKIVSSCGDICVAASKLLGIEVGRRRLGRAGEEQEARKR